MQYARQFNAMESLTIKEDPASRWEALDIAARFWPLAVDVAKFGQALRSLCDPDPPSISVLGAILGDEWPNLDHALATTLDSHDWQMPGATRNRA